MSVMNYSSDIKIIFNKVIANDPAIIVDGHYVVAGWNITAQEYDMIPDGQLLLKTYDVGKIRFFQATLAEIPAVSTAALIDSRAIGQSIYLMSNYIAEGFEAETFVVALTGTYRITTVDKHTGTKCLQSAAIGDNGVSTNYITFNAVTGAKIGLWYRVSSEGNYDKLWLYLNDVLKVNAVSGEGDWTYVEWDASDGSNVIKMVYAKDGSVGRGSDCAFLDDLTISSPYASSGSAVFGPYIIPPMVEDPISSMLDWTEAIPTGTSVAVKAAISDAIPLETDYLDVIKGGTIPNLPAAASGKNLYIKVYLNTTDALVSPSFSGLNISILGEIESDKILVCLKNATRMKNPIGQIRVQYTKALGNLVGEGNVQVEDFDFSFLSTGITPVFNPNDVEHLTVLNTLVLTCFDVVYRYVQLIENITALSSLVIVVTKVGDLPI